MGEYAGAPFEVEKSAVPRLLFFTYLHLIRVFEWVVNLIVDFFEAVVEKKNICRGYMTCRITYQGTVHIMKHESQLMARKPICLGKNTDQH